MTTAPSERALVPFVSVDHMLRLVARTGVEEMLARLMAAIEAAFARWQSFEKVARIATHSPEGVIELMPSSDGILYGMKYVNGHPLNPRAGRQTVTAFGVLAEVTTGYPVLISEMTLLTALRTAATSALAARLLAPAGTRRMALIGCGAQAEFQALAMRRALGIAEVALYDIDPRAMAKARGNLAGSGIRVIPCESPESAIEGAGIITTATADKRRATILSDNMVGAGVHLNAVGGDCPGKTELARGILERAAIFVEYAPQTRVEGECQQLPAGHPVTELWQVVTGQAAGRRGAGEVTLFDSVGFAVEDFAALALIREMAAETGLFAPLDLLADPDDPRDLFGMIARSGG